MADTLDEALAAAFDAEPAPAASTGDEPAATTQEPDPAGETLAATASTPDAAFDPDPATEAGSPAAAPTPNSSDGEGVSAADLKAIRDRVATEHPELQPVLDATLREMQRGLNKKFETIASLKKEAAEAVVRDERIKAIPESELLQVAEWYRMAQTNPAAAADHLAKISENLRAQAQNPQNPNPYGQLPPQVAAEFEQMRGYMHQQTQAQVIQQIEGEFTKLAPEFGNQAIPETQRIHVLETVQQRGLGAEDIGMVWRGLYGLDYARADGIKKGQALREQKTGLSAGSTAAAPPPSAKDKPNDLWSALDAVCTSHGIR